MFARYSQRESVSSTVEWLEVPSFVAIILILFRGGTTTSRASEINKFMSLLSMASPIENLSIITFDSWLSRGRG